MNCCRLKGNTKEYELLHLMPELEKHCFQEPVCAYSPFV